MSSVASIRLRKELREIARDSSPIEVEVEASNDILLDVIAIIRGPLDTPYECGHFCISIRTNENYPFVAPKVRFQTKIWHPNISPKNGETCLDILRGDWVASMSLHTILLCCYALLLEPTGEQCMDRYVGIQFKEDPQAFYKKAKEWTKKYARSVERKIKNSDSISPRKLASKPLTMRRIRNKDIKIVNSQDDIEVADAAQPSTLVENAGNDETSSSSDDDYDNNLNQGISANHGNSIEQNDIDDDVPTIDI